MFINQKWYFYQRSSGACLIGCKSMKNEIRALSSCGGWKSLFSLSFPFPFSSLPTPSNTSLAFFIHSTLKQHFWRLSSLAHIWKKPPPSTTLLSFIFFLFVKLHIHQPHTLLLTIYSQHESTRNPGSAQHDYHSNIGSEHNHHQLHSLSSATRRQLCTRPGWCFSLELFSLHCNYSLFFCLFIQALTSHTL